MEVTANNKNGNKDSNSAATKIKRTKALVSIPHKTKNNIAAANLHKKGKSDVHKWPGELGDMYQMCCHNL